MRIAICDDEKNIRELIGDKVTKQYPEAEIIFFSSGEELLLADKNIDLLFWISRCPVETVWTRQENCVKKIKM